MRNSVPLEDCLREAYGRVIADAVAFLASPQAGYITGVTLHVNGGMHME